MELFYIITSVTVIEIAMDITIKPLSPELIPDYLYFFDNMLFKENPDWDKCYCFSFHFTGAFDEWTKENNRKAVQAYITDGRMKGYLAFYNDKPIAWCNVNDRNNYEALADHYAIESNENEKIGSIVCFITAHEYRRKGIARKMLSYICDDYEKKHYDFLEAYPAIGTLSEEKNYKGPQKLYEAFNFEKVKEQDSYAIFRKKLN